MHALYWLNDRILRGAFQPIERVHFFRSCYRSRYLGLCDGAFTLTIQKFTLQYKSSLVNFGIFFSKNICMYWEISARFLTFYGKVPMKLARYLILSISLLFNPSPPPP